MSEDNKLDDLFIQSIKDLRDELKGLDTKFDIMKEILVRNTAVLEEHERRSTASEKRLDIVEEKVLQHDTKLTLVKGFFLYAGAILGVISTIAGIINYLIIPFLGK